MKSPGTQRARLISHFCGALSAGAALFWLIETVRGQVPGDLHVFATIFYFALIALSFLLFLRGRNIVVASWWPFLPVAAYLAMDQQDRFRVMGVSSLAAAIGLVTAMTILQRQRRRAVRPDRPSTGGLTL